MKKLKQKKYQVIVSIRLEYEVNATDIEEAIIEVENVELPGNYVEDSFEIDVVKELDDE